MYGILNRLRKIVLDMYGITNIMKMYGIPNQKGR